jgi:sodium/bile acid cotransporter 7
VRVISFVLMFLIFFCSGLALKTREVKAAFGRRALAGTTWGLAAICAITPTLGFLVRLIKITPPEYITGLVIMLTAPTTLGVGISMTQRSRGNVGLAIALTVVSNAIGVAVMPLWLETLMAKGTQQQLARPFPLLIAKLAVNNLLPTVLGKLLREVSPKKVAPWADRNKAWLGVFSNFCLAVIILQNISGARDELLKTAVGVFFIVVALAIGYHALFLVVNWLALSALRVPAPEKAASLILASQKSAPVALTAIEFITNDETVQGLLAVPCIIGQLGQVFMGHPLTVWLGKRNARFERREKAAREADAERTRAEEARVAAEGVEGGGGSGCA